MAEVDIAAVFQLVGTLAKDTREFREEMREFQREMLGFQHETLGFQKETKQDIASLRQALTEYHSSVLGHGVLISDLERRIRRSENHLNLPPIAAE